MININTILEGYEPEFSERDTRVSLVLRHRLAYVFTHEHYTDWMPSNNTILPVTTSELIEGTFLGGTASVESIVGFIERTLEGVNGVIGNNCTFRWSDFNRKLSDEQIGQFLDDLTISIIDSIPTIVFQTKNGYERHIVFDKSGTMNTLSLLLTIGAIYSDNHYIEQHSFVISPSKLGINSKEINGEMARLYQAITMNELNPKEHPLDEVKTTEYMLREALNRIDLDLRLSYPYELAKMYATGMIYNAIRRLSYLDPEMAETLHNAIESQTGISESTVYSSHNGIRMRAELNKTLDQFVTAIYANAGRKLTSRTMGYSQDNFPLSKGVYSGNATKIQLLGSLSIRLRSLVRPKDISHLENMLFPWMESTFYINKLQEVFSDRMREADRRGEED